MSKTSPSATRCLHQPDRITGYREWIASLTRKDTDPIAKQRWYARKTRKREYLESEHQFQMKLGNTAIGRPITMTGLEARKRNDNLEGKFTAALDKGESVRLARWFLVRPDAR